MWKAAAPISFGQLRSACYSTVKLTVFGPEAWMVQVPVVDLQGVVAGQGEILTGHCDGLMMMA
jgi:hypothetical protein